MGKGKRKVALPHLVGSKWTAVNRVLGWKHYQVCNRQDRSGLIFAELEAVCDPNVRLWLNARTLNNRKLWRTGWQTLGEGISEPEGDSSNEVSQQERCIE